MRPPQNLKDRNGQVSTVGATLFPVKTWLWLYKWHMMCGKNHYQSFQRKENLFRMKENKKLLQQPSAGECEEYFLVFQVKIFTSQCLSSLTTITCHQDYNQDDNTLISKAHVANKDSTRKAPPLLISFNLRK